MVRKVYFGPNSVKRDPVELFARRWHVRVLALLYELNGARFVVLKGALGISADSLTRALDSLLRAGWVQRNPGYGHPLRPEYVLTESGRALAAHCSRFQATVEGLEVGPVIYRKWSAPSLIAIERGVERFSDLRDALRVTPRALTQSLVRLRDADLVTSGERYANTRAGSRIARAAMALLA